MDSIYLDNNASTPMLPAVFEAMRPFYVERAANPASSHHAGRHARRALEDAREQIAALLDAAPDEIIFTSGATEANNLAIFGLCGPSPGHILLAPIEHPCVVEPVKHLAESGFQYELIAVDEAGVIQTESVAKYMRAETRMLCAQLANHETGAIQPVAEIANLASPAIVHCDAAAAAGKMHISFRDLDAASMTISAHKFHGPKGIGALVLRRDIKLRPALFGGHQQHGKRPGTEPVALAVGMATALELAVQAMDERRAKVTKLRQAFLQTLHDSGLPIVINGPHTAGIPHTLNISFPGCKADVLLMRFDLAGIACSTGSACSSGSLLPSPVLQAMGVADDVLRSAMRFSFSHLLNMDEVTEAARRISNIVAEIRNP